MINLPRLDGSGPRLPASGSGQGAPTPPAPVAPVAGTHAAGDTPQEAFQRLNQIALAQLTLGKSLQADVLSRVDERTFLLKLSDGTHQSAVRAGLPDGLRAGDTLQLRLVALVPRPTFLLLDGADGGSAPTSLSHGARLIDLALQQGRSDAGAAAIAGKSPLLAANSNPDARQLAGTLQQALAGSGLFYESHLRQWSQGRRTLAQLQQEPQASLAHAGGARPAAGAGAAEQQIDIVSAWTNEAARSSHEADNRLLQLVGQQLHALENQRLTWMGELVPNLPLHWTVQEESEQQHEAEAQPEAPTRWTSTLKLELPSLGKIDATLHLEGGSLRLKIAAADASTQRLLHTQGGFLADALDVAGMQLDALLVQAAPQP